MFGEGHDGEEEEPDGNFTFGEQVLQYADIPVIKEGEKEPDPYDSEEFKQRVMHELEEGFKLLDINGDGKISLNELLSAMKSVDKEIDVEDALLILEEIDQDGDGELNFDEYKETMYDKLLNGTVEDDLQEAFDVFDTNKDGFISASEIKNLYEKLGKLITKEEAQDIMFECDVNADGLIDFEEFIWFYGKMNPLYFKKFQPKPPSGVAGPIGAIGAGDKLGTNSDLFKSKSNLIMDLKRQLDIPDIGNST